MYRDQESVFYYLTVMNEQYAMPPMPEGSREGILKGMYRLQAGGESEGQAARRSCLAAARFSTRCWRRRSCSRSTTSPPTSGA